MPAGGGLTRRLWSPISVIPGGFLGHRVAGTRPAGNDTDAQAELAELADLNEEVRTELRLRHGSEAHALVQRTRRFVEQHPVLNEIMSTDNLGSRRDVVEALTARVRRHGLGR